MLQLASVLCRNILGNTSLYELSGKELVLFIDLLGDLLALLCEGECAIVLFYQAFLLDSSLTARLTEGFFTSKNSATSTQRA